MEDPLLKCLHCSHTPLQRGDTAYGCGRCGASYPIQLGVPLFLKNVRVAPSGRSMTRDVAARVCASFNIPFDDAAFRALQRIFSFEYHHPDLPLSAENNYFFNRIKLAEAERQRSSQAAARTAPVNRDIRYSILSHHIPAALPRDSTLFHNVRISNTGPHAISSRGPAPVNVSYHWRNLRGEIEVFEGFPTPLPVDLLPGRSISVPIAFRTPALRGPYMLELVLVQENGSDRLEENAFRVGVEIVRSGPERVPDHWELNRAATSYSYNEDHYQGQRMLVEEVSRRAWTSPRILEIGGCCNPAARGLPGELYSVDIDVQTLQVGQLLVKPGERLQFLCADVHDLPFAAHSFDCVVVFSALHHFMNPVAALLSLKRLLKKNGVLAVMCEPVGSYLTDPGVVAELEQGINEQVFTAAEYHAMFMQAGLFSPMVQIDGGSLKAFLQAEPASGQEGRLSRSARFWSARINPWRIWRGIRRRLLARSA